MERTATSRWSTALAAGSIALLALSGCSAAGSSGSSGSSSTGAESLTQDEIDLALQYTGGAAGEADDSLDPVKIGLINVDGGAVAFPQASNAAQIAADFINDHSGGIGGHPLVIEECDIVEGEADAQKCAQQFLNDDSVTAISLGMTVLGTGAIYSTVAGRKFVFGKEAFNSIDLDQENVTFVQSGSYGPGAGAIIYASQFLDADTVAVAYDGNDPGSQAGVTVMNAVAEEHGITLNAVAVADASQWGAALISAGAQNADAITVYGALSVCVPAANAIASSGFADKPVITFDFCQDESVAEALGDYPEWTYLSSAQSPLIDSADAALYNAIQDTYSPDANRTGGAQGVVGTIFALANVLGQVGYDALGDTDAIASAAVAFEGPILMAAQTIGCGQYEEYDAVSVCSTTAFPVDYVGDGVWEDPTGGVGLDTEGIALRVAAEAG